MPKQSLNFIISLILCLLTVQSFAAKFKSTKGEVTFTAVGKPAMLKIHGKGAAPKAELSEENGTWSGDIQFDVASLDTGISLRDDHMKNKYLEVAKYPQAKLSLQKFAWQKKSEELKLQGFLTLHGEKHPLEDGILKVKTDGKIVNAEAEFEISLRDYKVEIPSYAGIKVADKVKVSVQLEGLLSEK